LDKAGSKYLVGRQPLWAVKKKAILRMLQRWLAAEQERGGEFIPEHFEWAFGPDRSAPPLTVPLLAGGQLYFQGRVDQIDVSPEQCLVIDYKVSADRNKYSRLLKEEALGRASFQAPVYQAAAAAALKKPAQAAYYLLRDLKRLKSSLPTGNDFFTFDVAERQEMRQAGRANFFNQVEETWTRLIGGDFSPSPGTGECDYCPFRLVCRGALAGEES